jgi:hypothetical protein
VTCRNLTGALKEAACGPFPAKKIPALQAPFTLGRQIWPISFPDLLYLKPTKNYFFPLKHDKKKTAGHQPFFLNSEWSRRTEKLYFRSSVGQQITSRMNKKYKSTIRSTLFALKIPKVYKETIIGSGSFSTEALCHSIVNQKYTKKQLLGPAPSPPKLCVTA